MRVRHLQIALLFVSLGCTSSDGDAGTATSGATDTYAASEFKGGEFQLSVASVQDECLDGSLQLMFMPQGNLEPYGLANTTQLPGYDSLPQDVVVALEAPFDTLTVTMDAAADGGLQIRDAVQADVLLSVPGSGECRANLAFESDIQVTSDSTLTLATTVTLTGFEHPDCPTTQPLPCTVRLDMRGDRIAP